MPRFARVAVFTGPGQPLELREVEVPDPTGTEILVRVLGCTLCGSDLHTYEGRRPGPVPSILGHEILGRIEAFGPRASRLDFAHISLREGDRVSWALVAHCGTCFYCRRGLPQKCENGRKYGHEALGAAPNGGLAEWCMLVPGTAVVRVPETLPDAVVCPANCATATVISALRHAGSLRGRTVLIQGVGLLGITACAIAQASGASAVIATDPRPERLARAARFGATLSPTPHQLAEVVAQATDGHGVDVAVELSGGPEAFRAGMAALRMGGIHLLVGAVFPAPPVPLELERVVRRNLRIEGIHNYAPEDLVAAVRFLSEHPEYPFAELVGEWLPLSRADEAFQRARSTTACRVGVRPEAAEPPA
jgi:alcohol dehydrogenase